MIYKLEPAANNGFVITVPDDKYGNSHIGNVWHAQSGHWVMSYFPTPRVQYIVGFRSLRDAKVFIEQSDPLTFLELLSLPNFVTTHRTAEKYPIMAMIGPPNEPSPSVICYVTYRELHSGTTEDTVSEAGESAASGQADGGP